MKPKKYYKRYVVLEAHGPKLTEPDIKIVAVRLRYHGTHTIIGFAKTKYEADNLGMRVAVERRRLVASPQ